jgi:hypothetical protein
MPSKNKKRDSNKASPAKAPNEKKKTPKVIPDNRKKSSADVSDRESSSDDDDGAENGKLTQQSITSMKGILKNNPSLKNGPAAKKPKLMTEAQATSSEDPRGTSLLFCCRGVRFYAPARCDGKN